MDKHLHTAWNILRISILGIKSKYKVIMIQESNMNTKKQRLSIRVIQGEGVITISACIPEDQVKNYGKLLWGLIGSGIVWAFSQLPLHPTPPANSPPILPLTSDQQTITDK